MSKDCHTLRERIVIYNNTYGEKKEKENRNKQQRRQHTRGIIKRKMCVI